MNLQKQQLLLRLFRYFKSRKGEPRFFNKRNICLLDDAAVILGAVLTVFFPDGE